MDAQEASQLLSRAAAGDGEAGSRLLDDLYDQLRAVAQRKLAQERAGHTLSATALVHEAYLKLSGQQQQPTDRAHFLALASIAMRRVLVSHARRRGAHKRGQGERAVTLEETLVGGSTDLDGILALDGALERLRALSARQALAITYKGFGGLTDREIAEVLDVSVPTVRRDLRLASAFLKRELADGEGEPAGAGGT
jgi:RNA polymerase sigma factor (TIGR02999 family)